MRIIKPIPFLLVLMMFPALMVQAQACGGAFNTVKVLDSKGKSIRGAIIEIVAQLPREEYKNLGYGKVIKMSVPDAESAIKRNSPMDYTEDIFCKNPLKQYAGITKVKNPHQFNKKEPSIENFGFCTGETYNAPLLLKVSAPNYLTDYYIGNYLGGCGNTYEFVLTEKKKRPKKPRNPSDEITFQSTAMPNKSLHRSRLQRSS